jgi:hypothetical protein
VRIARELRSCAGRLEGPHAVQSVARTASMRDCDCGGCAQLRARGSSPEGGAAGYAPHTGRYTRPHARAPSWPAQAPARPDTLAARIVTRSPPHLVFLLLIVCRLRPRWVRVVRHCWQRAAAGRARGRRTHTHASRRGAGLPAGHCHPHGRRGCHGRRVARDPRLGAAPFQHGQHGARTLTPRPSPTPTRRLPPQCACLTSSSR